MKKITLIILLVAYTSHIEAQNLSIGYRAGVNQWFDLKKTGTIMYRGDEQEVNMNHEVFIGITLERNGPLNGE